MYKIDKTNIILLLELNKETKKKYVNMSWDIKNNYGTIRAAYIIRNGSRF